MTTPVFAPGSISIRLYPHNELRAPDIVRELCSQAALALDAGFDGVMTSEHHGGFSGYLPNPIQVATFILAERTFGWAAPAPVLLPLRPTAMVAEELAWLQARFPDRVGLGVAAGALELDFTVMGCSLADAVPRFKAELPWLVAMLRGEDLGELSGDRALQACRTSPVPVLSAAASEAAARRAARVGAGILIDGMGTPDRARALCAAYDAAGGTHPKVLIRRVWLGPPPEQETQRQQQVYASYAPARAQQHWAANPLVTSADASDLAAQLAAIVAHVGADALNVRVHVPGIDATRARDQIERLGTAVLPELRAALPVVSS